MNPLPLPLQCRIFSQIRSKLLSHRSCKTFATSHYHRTVHVPDGFINAPVSVAAGVVAAGAVAVSLRGARRELDERTAPLAGLVAAFIFAVQMLNFPVAAGTSGHLLGGALAAILVGPLHRGPVRVRRAAHAGHPLRGRRPHRARREHHGHGRRDDRRRLRHLPRTGEGAPQKRRSVTVSAFVAAAALRAGRRRRLHARLRDRRHDGRTDRPGPHRHGRRARPDRLGEAAITAFTVGAVIAVRPDLVYGARGLRPTLQLRVGGELVDAAPDRRAGARPRLRRPLHRTRKVWLTGLAASLAPRRLSSASTPPPAPTAWRRSPPTRASTRRSRTTPPPTPRSPTTASRTSPTPGSPAASPA